MGRHVPHRGRPGRARGPRAPGAYHRLALPPRRRDGRAVFIETTRPELLAACVALVAHPDDERYQPLFGTTVRTPVFGVEVPVLAHALAEPDKGSGIAMICTFGDTTDVTWWRELDLPDRARSSAATAASAPRRPSGQRRRDRPARVRRARRAHRESGAKARIVELLARVGRPRRRADADHPPGEVLREGRQAARDRDEPPVVHPQRRARRRAAQCVRSTAARELDWHPDHMRHRYEHWVEGLNGDWLISRQRFFGVPIPVWYRLDARRRARLRRRRWCPTRPTLPIDPSSDAPPGFDEAQRGQPGGFIGDPDVMDTWATSSLTPQIACGWGATTTSSPARSRWTCAPRRHEIIRTWLFSTVVRAHFEHGRLPWRHAAINGWILDPDRKKMSKSKGNVVTPIALLEKYGTDAVRYWSASARPGTDTAFDEGADEDRAASRHQDPQRVAASRSNLGADRAGRVRVTEPIDRAMLGRLAALEDASDGRLRRPSTTHGRSSAPRRSSGRSATTTSSWSRAAPTDRRG